MISESVDSILARQTQNQQAAASSNQNIVDKDGFLKLLIAQMQNQDPFEPMENAEMMSQMAEFSTLEQLQNINGNLTSGLQWDLLFNQTINNTMATSLIGREIEATGDVLILGESGDATFRYELPEFAKDVTIQVLDISGNIVYTEHRSGVDAGTREWRWDGRDDSGSRLPPGSYSVQLDARNTGDQNIVTPTYRVGIVAGIEYENGAAYLIVDGQRISLGEVQRISMAGGV
jgi:flagellar basal-body rod modification protein FlgD